MGEIRLQMIDSHISSHWWQELVKYFVNVGNSLEIRCWKEESEEIQQALQYGNLTEANYEVSIKGIVTKEFLTETFYEIQRKALTLPPFWCILKYNIILDLRWKGD